MKNQSGDQTGAFSPENEPSPNRGTFSGAPHHRKTLYRIEAAGVVLTVDAAVGARVVEFSLDGEDALLGASVHHENYGSTLWTSPQSDWGWPPPAALDRAPYRGVVHGGRFTFDTNEPLPNGLVATKAFGIRPDGVVEIEYGFENRGGSAVLVAPWEVTRVERRGLTFFPRGSPTRVTSAFPTLDAHDQNGVVWIDHRRSLAEDRKLFADGAEGWLAYATDRFVFVKRFEDIPGSAAAPGEAEVEIFANASPAYVELEQQGALTRLEPGDRSSWKVAWHIVRFPRGAALEPGDRVLVTLARSMADVAASSI